MLAQAFHQTEAISIRQPDVQDHQAGSKGSTKLERCLARAGMQHMHPSALEGGTDDARQIEIILYQKDLRPGLLPVQDGRELLQKVRLLRGHLQPTIRSQSESGGLAYGVRAKNDDWHIGRGRLFFQDSKSLPSRHVRQGQIEEQRGRRLPLRVRQSLASTGRFDDVVTVKAQARSEARARFAVAGADKKRFAFTGGNRFRTRLLLRVGRKEHAEGGAADGILLRPDTPSVLVDDGAADGESQTRATLLARVRSVHLLKAVEDGLQFVLGDATTLISDTQRNSLVGLLDRYSYGGIGWGELDGVAQQVRHHLLQAIRISDEIVNFGAKYELNRGIVRNRSDRFDGLLCQLGERTGPEAERRAAGFHALQVQNVVDQAHQPIGIVHRDAKQVGGFLVHLAQQSGGEQPERSSNRSQRGAQFVTDGGDELILHSIKRLPLADVAEVQNTSCYASVHLHWGERELDRKGAAVRSVEDVLSVCAVLGKKSATNVAMRSAGGRAAVDILMNNRVHEAACKCVGYGA